MSAKSFFEFDSNSFKKAFNFVKGAFTSFGNRMENFGNNIYSGAKKLWEDFTGQTVNNQNLEFQRETQEYNKALNQQLMEREDNAYQRTQTDMRAAGLNPLSMSGTNGAGTPVGINSMQSQKTSSLQAVSQVLDVMNQLSVTRSNATLSTAQSNLINAQADNQRIKNIYENDILASTLSGIDLGNIGKRFENERSNINWNQEIRNLAFNEQFGISDNMPELAKLINIGTHQGKLKDNWYKENQPSSWETFGKNFKSYDNNPSFTNLQSLLEKSNLMGALEENKLGNALLKLLGIGI